MSNEKYKWVDEMDDDWQSLKKIIAVFAKSNTNQTLQELKEKVNGLHTYDLKELFPDDPTTKYLNKSDVITLIDEAINE